MAITNINQELIQKKHELMRKKDTAETEKEKEKISLEMSRLDRKIQENAIKAIQEFKNKPSIIKSSYDEKELKKILNEKYKYYKEQYEVLKVLITENVEKKKLGRSINEKAKTDGINKYKDEILEY